MREYLPLLFEGLIAGAVILWGVRELVLLNREETKDEDDAE
jgi:hypothetical protein